MDNNCIICFEAFISYDEWRNNDILNDKRVRYSCKTCVDGKICWNCFDLYAMKKKNHCSTGLMYKDEEFIKDALKCPCCRDINWSLLYSDIVKRCLVNDLVENSEEDDWFINGKPNKAIKLFYKNHIETDECNIVGEDLMEYVNEAFENYYMGLEDKH